MKKQYEIFNVKVGLYILNDTNQNPNLESIEKELTEHLNDTLIMVDPHFDFEKEVFTNKQEIFISIPKFKIMKIEKTGPDSDE